MIKRFYITANELVTVTVEEWVEITNLFSYPFGDIAQANNYYSSCRN
ncbi:hypothetical protein OAG16_00950 [Saprospiraceae bacterium]|nr:hypothetical protein [Saprospiraceae bacterium]MDG1433076.1 hypothetical protein [Saprospiraceae bacterium]